MTRPPLFHAAILLSLSLHAGAAFWAGTPEEAPAVEIDLTRPISASPARERAAAAAAAPSERISHSGAGRPPSGLEAAAPAGSASETAGGEDAPAVDSVPGGGPGSGGWHEAVRPPLLLDTDRVRGDLRRLYPEEERRAGKEGEVIADLRVDSEGRVTSYEIVRSAGSAFDEAAGKALGALRFSPAMAGSRPVAVKVRQRIAFRLD